MALVLRKAQFSDIPMERAFGSRFDTRCSYKEKGRAGDMEGKMENDKDDDRHTRCAGSCRCGYRRPRK